MTWGCVAAGWAMGQGGALVGIAVVSGNVAMGFGGLVLLVVGAVAAGVLLGLRLPRRRVGA